MTTAATLSSTTSYAVASMASLPIGTRYKNSTRVVHRQAPVGQLLRPAPLGLLACAASEPRSPLRQQAGTTTIAGTRPAPSRHSDVAAPADTMAAVRWRQAGLACTVALASLAVGSPAVASEGQVAHLIVGVAKGGVVAVFAFGGAMIGQLAGILFALPGPDEKRGQRIAEAITCTTGLVFGLAMYKVLF